MTQTYDCRGCGACCLNPLGGETHARLEPHEREPARRAGLPVIGGRLAALPYPSDPSVSSCVAFRGHVGGPCSCHMYETRPAECREFQPGSLECLAARRRFGLPTGAAPEGGAP